jgi:hypothetical protein
MFDFNQTSTYFGQKTHTTRERHDCHQPSNLEHTDVIHEWMMGIAVPGDVTFNLLSCWWGGGGSPFLHKTKSQKAAAYGGQMVLLSLQFPIQGRPGGGRPKAREAGGLFQRACGQSGGVRESSLVRKREAASVNESNGQRKKAKESWGSSEPAIFFTSLSYHPISSSYVPVVSSQIQNAGALSRLLLTKSCCELWCWRWCVGRPLEFGTLGMMLVPRMLNGIQVQGTVWFIGMLEERHINRKKMVVLFIRLIQMKSIGKV